MKRGFLLASAMLAITSTLALAAPQSLLPPGFDDPLPAPPSAPTEPAPGSAAQGSTGAPSQSSTPVVQPLPVQGSSNPDAAEPSYVLPANLPTLAELEEMESDEIDALFGLKPKYDVPPGARRAVRQIGVIGPGEGGFPTASLAGQPSALIRAVVEGARGPVVSRWGHILMRRALASRMDAPRGMDPVAFATLRAGLLNRMGEGQVARALVQDVDSANYDRGLADAAYDAFLSTGDLLGMCPVARLKGDLREDSEWNLLRSICAAYSGQARRAERDLNRALGKGEAPRIDILLAQRYAGAASDGRRAVNIEWDAVEELTPWRFSLARALGVELPEGLIEGAGPSYDIADVLIPAVPLARRMSVSELAARRGVLSSAAMVDLYSLVWADSEADDAIRAGAADLREAYVATAPADRLAAMQRLWGDGSSYGRLVLTAYAAARLSVDEGLTDDPSAIVASMLAGGLDRNAMRWANTAQAGSLTWAMLALAKPGAQGSVDSDALDVFVDDDGSAAQRKSRFLLAGLAGLDRLDAASVSEFSGRLNVDLDRDSNWSRAIDRAGEFRNAALVSLLAGLGMQGESWDRMTARHLFHIVRALRLAGLDAEARMIAAEAVARG